MSSPLARNRVEISGKGQVPMVFLHGFGCDRTMWRFVVPAFEDHFKIVLYDLTGSGRSDLSSYDRKRYGSLDGHADDLVEILEELDLRDAVLVGHSVSSMIVALAANKAPERVGRVVMVGPSPRYIDDVDYEGGFSELDLREMKETLDSNFFGWSSQIAPAMMGAPDQPELGAELTNSFCRTDPDIAAHFFETTFFSDHREDAKSLKHDTLLLQCRDDIIADLPVGNWLDANMQNSRLVVLDATGHCPHMSAPDQTIGAMRPFVSAVL